MKMSRNLLGVVTIINERYFVDVEILVLRLWALRRWAL